MASWSVVANRRFNKICERLPGSRLKYERDGSFECLVCQGTWHSSFDLGGPHSCSEDCGMPVNEVEGQPADDRTVKLEHPESSECEHENVDKLMFMGVQSDGFVCRDCQLYWGPNGKLLGRCI